MFITPGAGSLMGYYLEDLRRGIKSQREFSLWDKAILITTDPIGSLNTIVDGMFGFGIESKLALKTFYQSPTLTSFDQRRWENDLDESRLDPIIADYLGSELTLRW